MGRRIGDVMYTENAELLCLELPEVNFEVQAVQGDDFDLPVPEKLALVRIFITQEMEPQYGPSWRSLRRKLNFIAVYPIENHFVVRQFKDRSCQAHDVHWIYEGVLTCAGALALRGRGPPGEARLVRSPAQRICSNGRGPLDKA